jgi:hypothetical protein
MGLTLNITVCGNRSKGQLFHNPNESLILQNFGKLTQNPEEITLKLQANTYQTTIP